MKDRMRFVSILFVLLVFGFALMHPSSARAALAVIEVSPNVIVNHVANTLTITGSDFASGAIVRLSGSALTSNFVNATTLTAIVPPGFGVGTYDVEVEVPSVGSAMLTGGLTILAPTATPAPFARPQIVIDMYNFSVDSIVYGENFNLNISFDNAGGSTAYGLQVTFSSTDLLMLRNGGVTAVGSLGTVGKAEISQSMTAAASLYGLSLVSVEANLTYYDDKGTTYSEKFTLYIPVRGTSGGGGGVAQTSTPTGVRRSQLVITQYETDVDPLQPGMMFQLGLKVENVGTIGAKSVTMIVGGGSSTGSGTPQAGIAAGSGEFGNFAPIGTSNVQSLGNLNAGESLDCEQNLIVNVTTAPGAYPLKISFVYTDANGNAVSDEQVITLLVYRLPQVEIGFYQPVGEIYAGQPGMLPLQVVNLGRSTVVLGMMTVSASAGMVENGQMLVGALDMGGYFPLDATLYVEGPGMVDVDVTITYTDDFNQPRTIAQTLTVEVMEGFVEPFPGEEIPLEPELPVEGESFWQKVWRFILGIFGLDSGSVAPVVVESVPDFEVIPMEPADPGGKG